jgi:hypothetical protein
MRYALCAMPFVRSTDIAPLFLNHIIFATHFFRQDYMINMIILFCFVVLHFPFFYMQHEVLLSKPVMTITQTLNV